MSDDFELLSAWAAGNREAGNTLVERHYRRVFTFFHLRVTTVADDLTQATLLACLEGLPRVRDHGSFRAYLFGIARHQLHGYLRDRRLHPSGLELGDQVEIAPSLSTSRLCVAHEEQRLLLRALVELPVDTQILLESFYWQGLTTSDIAPVLGIPVSTVTTRLSRARTELREAIQSLRAREEPRRSLLDGLESWAASLRGSE